MQRDAIEGEGRFTHTRAMTSRSRVVRGLLGVCVLMLVLASTACGYIEYSPAPRPTAKVAARAIKPNPPRPGDPVTASRAATPTATAAATPVSTPTPSVDVQREPLESVSAKAETGGDGASVHTVQHGETLFAISQAYGVDVFALADYNGLSAPFSIFDGQRLKVPPLGASLVPAPPAGDSENAPLVASLPAVAQPLPSPPANSNSGFIWPLRGKIISTFGPKSRGLRNDGINIAAARGTAVKAVENGVVAYAGNELRGFGNMILIKHASGWISTYAHNDVLLVQRGGSVRKGQVIARVGSTGRADEPQLHFELRKGSTPVDPLAYLRPKA